MPDLVRRRSGQAVGGIPVDDWNAFVDSSRWVQSQQKNNPDPFFRRSLSSIRVPVRSATGTGNAAYEVLGIDSDPEVTADDDLDEFQNSVVFNGNTPFVATHFARFVVMQDHTISAEVGFGVIDGVTIVKINVLDAGHPYADVKDGDKTQLESSFAGAARILWKQAGTGTDKWAVVKLGDRPHVEYRAKPTANISAGGTGTFALEDFAGNPTITGVKHSWMAGGKVLAQDTECLIRFFWEVREWHVCEAECP